MPRKNPSECIEHRITLGTYERKEFKEFIDAKTALAKAESAVKTGEAVAYGVGIAGVLTLGYLGFKTWHESVTGVEPSLLNVLSAEGRGRLLERVRKDREEGKTGSTLFSILFDPLGINPFW